MYETLVRQQEITRDPLPTVEEAIARLKEIESRKHNKRLVQIEQARSAKSTNSAKRKADAAIIAEADDLEHGSSAKRLRGEMPPLEEPDVKDIQPSGLDAAVTASADENLKSEVAVSGTAAAEVSTGGIESILAAPTQAIAELNGNPSTLPPRDKLPALDEKRYAAVKPSHQTRGHTSYLTFACLLPLDSIDTA